MNKLSIIVILTLAVCSTYGISAQRSIRSASEVSTETNPIAADVATPQDSAIAESADVFTARGKGNNNKGGHKHKMEVMHMGLSYIKMVLSTLMAAIGHVFAFKSVGLSLISVLIQIAQFIMVLKKNKESAPPSYKIIETPWHTSPTESYGSYGSYAGHAKSSGEASYPTPYSPPPAYHAARRRR